MLTRVNVDNEHSDTRTVIEIETEDRIGLLYMISQAFAELGLDISVAKILTEKGAAIDTFYVTDIAKQKVTDPKLLAEIESRLRAAIAALDQPAEPVSAAA